MKIFEIIPHLGSGGAERFVVDLCNELADRHEITLIVLFKFDYKGFFLKEISPKINVICMEKKPGLDVKCLLKIKHLINQQQPDIVHTHLSGFLYTVLNFWKKSKTKFIYTVHSDAAYDAKDFINRTIRKLAFKSGRVAAVTISEESQKSFEKLYGTKSSLIYNGRPQFFQANSDIQQQVEKEINSLRHTPNTVIIINVARLNKVKNQLTLAQAVSLLNQQGYKIELISIGEANDKEVLYAIQALKSPNIHLLGSKTNPRDYLAQSDAFCLSSFIEGMPITLIECFSVGVIPICTPVGGMKNMIYDGVNGLLAEGTTQADIEKALIRFLKLSPEERKLMREKSLESFKAYDIKTCCHNYECLMRKLIV